MNIYMLYVSDDYYTIHFYWLTVNNMEPICSLNAFLEMYLLTMVNCIFLSSIYRKIDLSNNIEIWEFLC